jgi:hypothetical protein
MLKWTFTSFEMPRPCKRQNDEKVVSHIHAKAQCEWDELVIVTQRCPPLPKPTLVKLTSKQLLQMLGLNV